MAITGKGKPPQQNKTRATLARTNLGLLLRAITFIQEHREVQHLYFEGNINSYTYADDGASLYDVLNLYNGKPDRIRDKLIQSMKNMEELEEYIEKTEDVQLGMMVEIVNEYGNEIPGLIKELKSKHVGDEEKDKAEMIFSTVHRAKGMEYDAVQLADDFVTEAKLEKAKADAEELKRNAARWNEEINLLYVAITRTKGLLRLPESLLPKAFPGCKEIVVLKKENQAKDEKRNLQTDNQKMKSFTGIRRAFKNAYEPWTPEADDELRKLFHQGWKIGALAVRFSRKPGAIVSRLKKIGSVPGEGRE